MSFGVFQNLYLIKTALSSSGSYILQGYQGTFVTGCPDSNKNYKHLWFYTMGIWLPGQVGYNQVPSEERVPIIFNKGYEWTREPHAESINQGKIDKLWEKPDPERNQNRLLENDSLAKYNWFSSFSTSGYTHNQPRSVRSEEEETVAVPMPHPAVQYNARIVVAADVASVFVAWSEFPQGMPTTSTSGL